MVAECYGVHCLTSILEEEVENVMVGILEHYLNSLAEHSNICIENTHI